MTNHRWIVSLVIAATAASHSGAAQAQARQQAKPAAQNCVEVVRHEADRRVDVLVGGKPFTAYVWPTTLKKPVLYPIRSATGVVVTRGYPLEPRPGERVDHPHHAGLWFNYGDVNGLDFWNNSDAIKADAGAEDGDDRSPVHSRLQERRRRRHARRHRGVGRSCGQAAAA